MRYYSELFQLFGITMTDDIAHWLQVKDRVRASHLGKARSQEFKKKRKAQFYEKLKAEKKLAKQERQARDGGIYQSGIGMTGGYADDDEELPIPHPPKRRRRITKKKNKPRTPATATPQLSTLTDAEELIAIDAMPLVDDSETSGSADFYDARDYYSSSEDDTTQIVVNANDVVGGSSAEI